MVGSTLPFVTEFLRQSVETEPNLLFCDYAHYLLKMAGCFTLPFDFGKVNTTFRIKVVKAEMEQRGWVLERTIYLNRSDLETTQRFTLAHEYMEMLVTGLLNEPLWRLSESKDIFLNKKETWCDNGACELLMPHPLFFPLINVKDCGINGAKELSRICNTSLLATMRRILESDLGSCVLIQAQARQSQQPIESWRRVPLQKRSLLPCDLFVKRSWKSPKISGVVQPYEILPMNSSFCRTYQDGKKGQVVYSRDNLNFRQFAGLFNTESILVTYEATLTILGLIEVPPPTNSSSTNDF